MWPTYVALVNLNTNLAMRPTVHTVVILPSVARLAPANH